MLVKLSLCLIAACATATAQVGERFVYGVFPVNGGTIQVQWTAYTVTGGVVVAAGTRQTTVPMLSKGTAQFALRVPVTETSTPPTEHVVTYRDTAGAIVRIERWAVPGSTANIVPLAKAVTWFTNPKATTLPPIPNALIGLPIVLAPAPAAPVGTNGTMNPSSAYQWLALPVGVIVARAVTGTGLELRVTQSAPPPAVCKQVTITSGNPDPTMAPGVVIAVAPGNVITSTNRSNGNAPAGRVLSASGNLAWFPPPAPPGTTFTVTACKK